MEEDVYLILSYVLSILFYLSEKYSGPIRNCLNGVQSPIFEDF